MWVEDSGCNPESAIFVNCDDTGTGDRGRLRRFEQLPEERRLEGCHRSLSCHIAEDAALFRATAIESIVGVGSRTFQKTEDATILPSPPSIPLFLPEEEAGG